MRRSLVLTAAVGVVSWGCARQPPPTANGSAGAATRTPTTTSAPAPVAVGSARASAKGPPFDWRGEPLLSGRDREARLEKECPWLTAEVAKSKGDARLRGPALTDHLANVAKAHGARGDSCLALLREGLESFQDDIVRAEAKSTLRVLAGAARSADATCLASASPVPAARDAFARSETYTPEPSEWNAPAWQCLSWRNDQPQRYRYSFFVDDAKRNFVAVAERGDGSEVLFVRGSVTGTDEPTVMTRK